MKPGEHPEFFRFPAPEGRSRESTITLDGEGHFSHEGETVDHMKLAQAMHTWISRHPDDGRFILTNGYDWTYFTVKDAPFFVRHLEPNDDGSAIMLVLSDGTKEPLDANAFSIGDGGALYTKVKKDAPRGPFEAKLTRHAQASLSEFLEADESGDENKPPWLVTPNANGTRIRFSPKSRDNSGKK